MKQKRRRRHIRLFFLAVMVVCLIPIGRSYILSKRHRTQQDALKKMLQPSEAAAESGVGNEDMPGGDAGQEWTGDVGQADENAGQAWTGDVGQADENAGQAWTGDVGQADGNAGQEWTGDVGQAGENAGQEWTGDVSQADGNAGQASNGGNEQPEPSKPAMLGKYAALYRENNDLIGWISIEGTGIDYPVLQCEDDEYYLHHDFYGEDSIYGCLYVRGRADVDAGTNFVIYGHNMRDGAMFGDLDHYLKESFFREHPAISFDTLYEERVYEIVAVFRSQVYNAEDDVFKYYQFYEADTREEFEDFYTNIKALSIYDTGVEAEFGDTFLTCSTCAYHVTDGRFVVVAKRREE